MIYELRTEDIAEHAQDLIVFHGRVTSFFRTSTREVSAHALEYLKGQRLCESRRNMSKISVEVSTMNEQALDNFTSVSPWKDRPLIEAIGREASDRISSDAGTRGLILDESGNGKKGKRSVIAQPRDSRPNQPWKFLQTFPSDRQLSTGPHKKAHNIMQPLSKTQEHRP